MTFTAATLWRKKWFIFPPVVILLWVLVDSMTEMMPTVQFSKMLLTDMKERLSLLGGSNQTSVGPPSRSECEVAYGKRRFLTREEERDPPILYSFPGES